MKDPSQQLPRDETGCYLHLKLKRFSSIDDLKMPFAKKTWTTTPQDAEVDIAPAQRSSCRLCHEKIEKGALRARLWLQCHKGCKNSAYFHVDKCLWEYPETTKLDSLDEIVGLSDLPDGDREFVEKEFAKMKESNKGKISDTEEVEEDNQETKEERPSPAKKRRTKK